MLLLHETKVLLRNGFQMIDSGFIGDNTEDQIVAMMVAEYCKDDDGIIKMEDINETFEFFKRNNDEKVN